MSQPRSYYPSRVSYEFQDFPVDDLPVIPHDWKDMSWRNDACPCFETDDGIFIFVDYVDPTVREYENLCRYSACFNDYCPVYTDHWETLLSELDKVRRRIALYNPYDR